MSVKLVLGPGQIRHFKNALRCLGGIGPELLLEAVPERVILRALNPAKSAFLSVTFANTFFESFMVFDSALVQASVLMKVRSSSSSSRVRSSSRVHQRLGGTARPSSAPPTRAVWVLARRTSTPSSGARKSAA
jgi:hypothetical protein